MSWGTVVQTVGLWYQKNIHNYNQGQYSTCSIANTGKVRHDCSGFVSACLRAAGIISPTSIYRSGDFLMNGAAAASLRRAGFYPMTYSYSLLQPFDIIAYNGHVEIYAGKQNGADRSWSWGSCHDGLNGRSGMPAYMAAKTRYVTIWRVGGTAPPISTLFMNTPFIPSAGYGGAMNFNSVDTANYASYDSTIDGNIFASAVQNSFTPTTTSVMNADAGGEHRTRIYSASNRTITIDELSVPINEGDISTETAENDINDSETASRV